jgi:hypothetical protein
MQNVTWTGGIGQALRLLTRGKNFDCTGHGTFHRLTVQSRSFHFCDKERPGPGLSQLMRRTELWTSLCTSLRKIPKVPDSKGIVSVTY